MPRGLNDHIFDVSVRWRSRLESANACADRLALMLTGLAAVHPLLARWNKRAETRLESSKPFCAMPPRIAWESDWGAVRPRGFGAHWRRNEPWGSESTRRKPIDGYPPPVSSGWMSYLCPDFARRISPPAGIVAERAPQGGLLMVVTESTFDGNNPAHVAAADAIQASLAPLQAAPY
jgi:hypothetical protein